MLKLSNINEQTVVIEGRVFSFGELIENMKKNMEKENYKKNEEEDEDLENEDDDEEVENGYDEDLENEDEDEKMNEDEDEIDLENSLEALMNEGNFADTMELINSRSERGRPLTDFERVELGKQKY